MWIYIGGDKWLPGVPARDLTEAEAELYQSEIEESGLYEWVSEAGESRESKPTPAPKPKAA